MAEVMLGKDLHPDRVIPIEKLYEIFNEYGIPYSFAAQHGIENNSFAVVRCKDCKHFNMQRMECENDYVSTDNEGGADYSINFGPDDFCSYGERKDND